MKPNLDRLPDTIVAPRTDPIYNCHGYLTKVPIAAIEPFIEAFSAPGEIVADLFAGSGMTGLAAVRLNRKARLSDISVLGRHIAQGYSTCVSQESLQAAASEVIESARLAVGDLYTTRREQDGLFVEVVRTVWSFVYRCPSCESELVYYEYVSKGAPPKSCSNCSFGFVRRNWGRVADVPVEVVVRNAQGRLTEQAVSAHDEAIIKAASEDPRQKEVPSEVIDDEREMFSRSGLGKAVW
jgi:hypothetical protein